ncbi:MAG: PEP/pyruvate-binding domain-containing protein [Synergistaceae bacterium]|nr:PEP/pyruvate-binding domain-containing protein [Synergistaceae bacterium]
MKQSLDNYDAFMGEDFFRDRGNLVGTGSCGGKAKGMAYAHAALSGTPLGEKISFPDLTIVLSTEVFRDYLDANHLSCLYDDDDWAGVQRRISESPLPHAITAELSDILDRFDAIGTPPLAVRSSSLMEDSVSLSFAGKYQTCFSPNCGPKPYRLSLLESCVRTVFASVFNPSARAYREKHGKKHRDEAIAVIIQSLSGKNHGRFFYPELAGTLFSRVFRRPNPRIKKEDGLMRLCFGMGTRSVDRCAARIFYLTNPSLLPAGNLPAQVAEASQENFDYIDRDSCEFASGALSEFAPFLQKEHKNYGAYVQLYADNILYSSLGEPEGPARPLFSFPELHLKERGLFDLSRELLRHMEEASGIPVDIEFACETSPERDFRLLQLRPLAAFEEMSRVEIPETPDEKIIFMGDRMVSNGLLENVEYLVYVSAEAYKGEWDPSAAARAIGEMNRRLEGTKYILAGPGRWGSRNPALGVPVLYAQICNCGCLVEISVPELNFSPELSYGTHFFLDMDSDGTLYLPVFGRQKKNKSNTDWLERAPYETGEHPSVRLYRGNFSVYLDGELETGIVVAAE